MSQKEDEKIFEKCPWCNGSGTEDGHYPCFGGCEGTGLKGGKYAESKLDEHIEKMNQENRLEK